MKKANLSQKDKNPSEGEYSLGKKQHLNEEEYKFIFIWEPPMMCLVWDITRILGRVH